MSKVATLRIKKRWLDMIASGEKKEEYRTVKPYYTSRLNGANRVLFIAGYAPDSPKLFCDIRSTTIGEGKEKWGAIPSEKYYVLEVEPLHKGSPDQPKELACWIYWEPYQYYCSKCVEIRLAESDLKKEFAGAIDYAGGETCGYEQGAAPVDEAVFCDMCGAPLHNFGENSEAGGTDETHED